MAIGTTSTLSNATRTQYLADYIRGAMAARVYDQFASPIGMPMAELQKGTSVLVNFLSDLAPATAAISQTVDVTPVTFRDATASITPTSRSNAIQDSELLRIQGYTNYGVECFEAIGKNMIESVDLLAQAAATQGLNVDRTAARASLDAGTASHRLIDTTFAKAQAKFATMKVPGFVDPGGDLAFPPWFAVMHPYPYHDLRTSGLIDDISVYQNADISLNYVLGKIGPFRLVVTPWAKTFWGAGIDNGTNIATTLNGDVNALDKTIVVASATSIAVGMALNIGTEETGGTHYPTNERVWIDDSWTSGTTLPIIGEGVTGGLRFDHATGAAVRNADSVYAVVLGGPKSLAKVYAENLIGDAGVEMNVGEFGVIVGPKVDGRVNQFVSLGWKYYGGYGRISESHLLRVEVSTSFEA